MASIGEWAEIEAGMRQREFEAALAAEDAKKVLGHYLWLLSRTDSEIDRFYIVEEMLGLHDMFRKLGMYLRPLTGLEAHNFLNVPLAEDYDWKDPYKWIEG